MSKYFALLTRLGADRLANAAALGTKIEITQMAVGDGGGKLPMPDASQKKLVNEKRRAAINVLSVDPKNTHQIIAEQVIPEHEGGWWIREIGLFDKDGVLMAVANCAETYKPQLQEGSGRTQTIRMVLIVSHTNAVTLKIDPSVVLATREYADASIAQAIREHEQSRRHPDATLTEKGFVSLSSAVNSTSENQAATPKAVKAAYELARTANQNADGRVPAGRKVNNKPLTDDITLKAADIGAQPAGNYVNTDTTNEQILRSRLAINDALFITSDGVGSDLIAMVSRPGERGFESRINGTYTGLVLLPETSGTLALREDVDNRVSGRLEKAKNGADIPDKTVFINNLGLRNAVNQAQNAVPRSRKINGKSLAGDLHLTAWDIGAQPVGNYIKTDATGEQVLRSRLTVNDAFFVTSDGLGSDLISMVSRPGKRGFESRINGIYTGLVVLPDTSGTLALVEQVIGLGQQWRDVTSSRKAGTTYTNETTSSIEVIITGQSKGHDSKVFVGGVVIASIGGLRDYNIHRHLTFIVPPNTAYRIEDTAQITSWSELR